MQAVGRPPQRAPDGAPLHYERHRPEQTTLYRIVQQHAAGFIAHAEASTGAELPRCGGSNGYRVRLWPVQLQRFADEHGLTIQVCHFPPGTSKWNKIEHRMFCHITNNWRGRPLLSRQVVVNLIGSVSTEQGLRVRAELDENTYEAGIKVSDAELAAVAIERDEFHGEWNYRIKPRAR